jgi:hypothetical protein
VRRTAAAPAPIRIMNAMPTSRYADDNDGDSGT